MPEKLKFDIPEHIPREGFIYLGGPYTAPDEETMQERYEIISACAVELVKRDYLVFSPISQWHPIAQRHFLPRDFTFWNRQNLGMLMYAGAFAILYMDGYLASKGLQAELNFAKEFNIDIYNIIYKKGEQKCLSRTQQN